MQMILNVIGRGMSVLNAMAEPRVHSQLYPDIVQYEELHGMDIPSMFDLLSSNIKSGGDGGNAKHEEDNNQGGSISGDGAVSYGNDKIGYSIVTPSSTISALSSRKHTVQEAGILGVAQFIGNLINSSSLQKI